MPSGMRRAVHGAIALVAFAIVTLAGPVALAQQGQNDPPPPWSGSALDRPGDLVTELDADHVDVAGHFRYQKPTATSEIVRIVVDLVDDPSDDFEPVDACDAEPVEIASDGTSASDGIDELAFRVDALPVACNGRFLLEATAETSDDTSYTLRATLEASIAPPAVETLTTSADAAAQQVTVDWEPVPADQLPPDTVGYLLQRAGPRQEDGSFGSFRDLRVLKPDEDTVAVDGVPEPGAYRYRVRTMRHGIDGPVLASITDTGAETATVDEPPPTTTTTTAPPAPTVGVAIPRPRPAPRLSPPTTADTGFEEELDYGDAPPRTTTVTSMLPELATELPDGGQSIVRDEGEDGVNLLIPAAGALVLIGWAGHLAYVNRLAKQL